MPASQSVRQSDSQTQGHVEGPRIYLDQYQALCNYLVRADTLVRCLGTTVWQVRQLECLPCERAEGVRSVRTHFIQLHPIDKDKRASSCLSPTCTSTLVMVVCGVSDQLPHVVTLFSPLSVHLRNMSSAPGAVKVTRYQYNWADRQQAHSHHHRH